jgi:peroxiredoxin
MNADRFTSRVAAGSVIAARDLVTVTGTTFPLPDHDLIVHLQFRRFAGCPMCTTHLRAVARRHDEIAAAGIREVVVFASTPGQVRATVHGAPFAIIADPSRRLYAEFGVEKSPRSVLHPWAWGPLWSGALRELGSIARGRRPVTGRRSNDNILGLPADFLIASDGHVIAAKYGAHGYDQWPVDEILRLALSQPAAGR